MCQILVRETNTLEAYRDLGNCCESLGRVYCLLRDFARAQPCFETLRSIRESLAPQLGTVQIHRELASCYEWLGFIAENLGQFPQARAWYLKSYQLLEALARSADSPELQDSLTVLRQRLARFL